MDTLLVRRGSKRRIADKIIPLFPKHDMYIELFFGAGGMFFRKPKAKYNICNDLDDDIFNLFLVLQDEEQRKKLYDYMKLVPYSESLLKHWKKTQETDAIRKAGRFLFLSNYTYMATGESLNYDCSDNSKQIILDGIRSLDDGFLVDIKFLNSDFRRVIKSCSASIRRDDRNVFHRLFIYADPPYLGTDGAYSTSWSEKDTTELFEYLDNYATKNFDDGGNNINFAISEFDSDKILELSERYNLYITEIGERRNLHNRRTEILITNYDTAEINRNYLIKN